MVSGPGVGQGEHENHRSLDRVSGDNMVTGSLISPWKHHTLQWRPLRFLLSFFNGTEAFDCILHRSGAYVENVMVLIKRL